MLAQWIRCRTARKPGGEDGVGVVRVNKYSTSSSCRYKDKARHSPHLHPTDISSLLSILLVSSGSCIHKPQTRKQDGYHEQHVS